MKYRLAERHAFKPIDLDAVPAFRHCSAREMMRPLEYGMSIFGKASRIRKILRQTGVPAGEAICCALPEQRLSLRQA